MISQQFVDYIRRQLAAGVAREDIKKALRINGLSEQDMAEGFAAVETAPSSPTPVPSAGPTVLSQPIPAVMPTAQAVAPAKAASLWAKEIPTRNKKYMKTSLAFVFGIDLVIVLVSGFSLMYYWIGMLVVFGVFAFFFYLENHVFSKRFADTESALDPWISRVIDSRNLIFLLNFVPLIQILGVYLLSGFLIIIPDEVIGGLELGNSGSPTAVTAIAPVLLVLYIILIGFRFATTNKQIIQAS